MLPVASKRFSKNGIVRFLEALWLLVEAREVPLDDGLHAVERFVLFDGTESGKRQRVSLVNGIKSFYLTLTTDEF